MFYVFVVIAYFNYLPQGLSEPRTTTRRYKPVIQVTEEIDINDITFTTSSPEYDRPSSHKTVNHHGGLQTEAAHKAPIYNKIPAANPSVFPHINYKDSYGKVIPVETLYSKSGPIVVPAIKYKPYKNGHDGFKPVTHKVNGSDKDKMVIFEPPTTFSGVGISESSKQFPTKVTPYSNQYLSTKPPTRATNYLAQDNRNFNPSPTFSPSIIPQVSHETSSRFTELPKVSTFVVDQKESNWEKPTKKPFYVKNSKKAHDSHNHQSEGIAAEEFSAKSEKVEENLQPSTWYKDSQQQSESYLSELSTVHQAESSANNLDGVADTLDLKTGERVEFQMYGMDGPQSYKFGFDTGKGHNRHFRFEERDKSGKVKGHYGYLDEEGKMRIMKYEADPITGFHAGPVEISSDNK